MTTLAFMLPLGMIGPSQVLIIAVLIIVLFGGKKIPELMRGVGRGVKEFKDAVNKDYSNEEVSGTTNETTKEPLASNQAPKETNNNEATK